MPPALRVDQLTKTFRLAGRDETTEVLQGVSVTVPTGGLTAVVGPSGSGKSTLLYCLSGLERASGGSVELFGQPLDRLSPSGLAQLYRAQVGFVFQSYNLVPYLTVEESVRLPSLLAGRPTDPADIQRVLAALGLNSRRRQVVATLSGGEQQRVALARALLTRPRILFADEPTGALDTATSQLVLDTLRTLADGEDDRTVVMVTHDLEAASRADRVLVLRDGRLVAELGPSTPAQLLAVIEQGKVA